MNEYFYQYDEERKFYFLKIGFFVFFFYLMYFLVTLFGSSFINYNPLSSKTIGIYFLQAVIISLFAFWGFNMTKIMYSKIIFLNSFFIPIVLFILIIALALSWRQLIVHYGSIKYIINHAYDIRLENIGKSESITSVYYTYILSLSQAFFSLSLSFYGNYKKTKFLYYALILFVIIGLTDMQTFGRIGILFAIFTTIGYFIIFRIKILNLKRILLMVFLYLILGLPRLFRGSFDNFSESVKDILPHTKIKIHPFFYSLLNVFVYFFSSLYAFDFLITYSRIQETYGTRNFAPIMNFINRFFLHQDKINLIDPVSYIPFQYNIYTILKDYISDFGMFGVILIPAIFGIILGKVFSGKNVFLDALKMFLLAWLFYTPIYNVFIFGSFIISFVVLCIFATFFTENKNEFIDASR